MRICFNARPAYDQASPRIFRALQAQFPGLEGTFVVSNQTEKATVCSILPGADARIISEHVKSCWGKGTAALLSRYEKEYDCAPIWKYIYMDRFMTLDPYDDILQYVCGMFSFYESVFSTGVYDFYFDETIATAQSYIAYFVAKRYGVQYLAVMAARGREMTHHYVVTDPLQHQFGFDPDYASKQYSPEITEQARALMQKYRENYSKPASMAYVKSKPRFTLKPLARCLKEYLRKENHNKYDLINYRCYRRSWNEFCFFFRYRRCKKYYRKEIPERKFVYFPLHYQPEASTLVCAPKYEKQQFYIDSWAKSLPADTVLAVKEHYALVGHRPLDFYRAVAKYPNVVILDPWCSSMELIKRAEAITTLTGTAGWEAMILGKPVYLGGRIYFDCAPGICDASEAFLIYDEKRKGAGDDEILRFLCEYVSNTFLGAAYFTMQRCLTEENIAQVARSLADAMTALRRGSADKEG